MNKLIVPVALAAVGMVAAAAWSQTPPQPNPNVTIYFTTPLEQDASRTVRLQSINIPAKTGNNFPSAPGRPMVGGTRGRGYLYDQRPSPAHSQGR
jgi:hypothetical protein